MPRLARQMVVVATCWLGAFVAGCKEPPCGPDTCAGCCDAAGLCQPGEADVAACGLAGAQCATCSAATEQCQAGGCVPVVTPENAKGELELIVVGPSGDPRAAELRFGAVFAGSESSRTVVVKNAGNASLDVQSLTLVTPDPYGSFAFPTLQPRTLLPGQTFGLEFRFGPPEGQVPQSQVYEAELRLEAGNAAPEKGVATISLQGLGITSICELPKTLAFGKLARNDTDRREVHIGNPSQVSASASVSAITSSTGDHAAFAFAAGSAQGDFTILPFGTSTVSIDFSPTQNKSYLAFVRMRASESCPEVNVTLTGAGVENVLEWSPQTVDCGYVSPGLEATGTLTFTNHRAADVTLTGLQLQNAGEFRIIAPAGQDPATLIVPGGQTAPLTIGCKPDALGPRQTTLTFSTNLATQPAGQVAVTVVGGGPDIEVQPFPTLAMGKVAYFAGVNPPSFARRKLTVRNVGTAPAVPDAKANLRLGTPDAQGNPQPPYFTVIPANDETAASEFTVDLPSTYNPTLGLPATVGANALDLVVTFTPVSTGLKEAKVTLFSNDPDEPAVEVTLSANAVDVPPCTYTVSPGAVNFGLISPPELRETAFTIRNLGSAPGEICLLSGLAPGAGTHAFFSLAQGELDAYQLAPGEQLQIVVRAEAQGPTPTGITNVAGTVEFYMSSPLKPQTIVSLNAQVGPTCLTVTPGAWDFATAQVSCSAATRTFNVYNTCGSPVTLTSVTMQAAAGQPSGGPSCPGTQPCPEFLMVQAPAIPAGGLSISPGQAPLTFQARYRPIDLGADFGAVALTATQSGNSVTYVVPLKGAGAAQGIHSDVFTIPVKPKADVLLAIDNSATMGGHQSALGSNFASFAKYAEAQKVDYRLAVITTDDASPAHQGRFVFGAQHPEKILAPTIANLASKFTAKVNVGVGGSTIETCLSPLLKAVTTPLSNDDNAGFLRKDASLALICVTDAPDQSNNPASYYLNRFWNLKGHDRKSSFTFSAIAGFNPSPPGSCPYDSGPDDGTYGYLVALTAGRADEICTPDWSTTLEEVGKTAFGFRTRFHLGAVPANPATSGVTVSIDGVNVPSIAGTPVWDYDAVSNAVDFQPLFVPEPGQTLVVQYQVPCL